MRAQGIIEYQLNGYPDAELRGSQYSGQKELCNETASLKKEVAGTVLKQCLESCFGHEYQSSEKIALFLNKKDIPRLFFDHSSIACYR